MSDELNELKLKRAKLQQVRLWKRHPLLFLTGYDFIEGRPLIYTLDEHDLANPVKPLPATGPVMAIASAWWDLKSATLVISKSRHVMASWTMVALNLWLALFHDGALCLYISKHRQATVNLLDRTKFIYTHLPTWLQEMFPTTKPVDELSKVELPFRHLSAIRALPRGAAQLREFTGSSLLVDEAGYVNDLEEVQTAAIPVIAGGGRVVFMCTPVRGSHFETMAYVQSDGSEVDLKAVANAKIIKQRIAEIKSLQTVNNS
ncbi:MAG: hypothetical protein QXQ02_04150 [Halobacteria archaeon]